MYGIRCCTGLYEMADIVQSTGSKMALAGLNLFKSRWVRQLIAICRDVLQSAWRIMSPHSQPNPPAYQCLTLSIVAAINRTYKSQSSSNARSVAGRWIFVSMGRTRPGTAPTGTHLNSANAHKPLARSQPLSNTANTNQISTYRNRA